MNVQEYVSTGASDCNKPTAIIPNICDALSKNPQVKMDTAARTSHVLYKGREELESEEIFKQQTVVDV